MKELYLHIGHPKTGSSALQRFLTMNKELLKKKGICYPFVECADKNIYEISRFQGGNDEFMKTLSKNIKTWGRIEYDHVKKIYTIFEKYSKILLSDEGLWYYVPEVISNLLKVLGADTEIQIKIIGYIRRQDELFESEWNESVKTYYGMDAFDEYVEKHSNRGYYYGILKSVSEVIGKENIFVRIYDQEKFAKGKEKSIYADFMSIFGIADISEFELPNIVVNPSLSRNVVEIQRVFNSIPEVEVLDKEFKQLRNSLAVEKSSDVISKAPSLLTYEQRKALLARYEEENRKIGREFFAMDISPFPLIKAQPDSIADNMDEKMYEGQNRDTIYFLGSILVSQAKKIEEQGQELEVMHYELYGFSLSCDMPKGSRIVIYGAGRKGCGVYHWLEKNSDYNVVGIVDKRFEELRNTMPIVRPREDIKWLDYDYILIAVKSENSQNAIQSWLEEEGVERDKIVIATAL